MKFIAQKQSKSNFYKLIQIAFIVLPLSLTACGGGDNDNQKQETPAGIQITAKILHAQDMANSDRRAIEERKKPSTKIMTTQAEFEAELAIFTGNAAAATIDPNKQQVILVNAGLFGSISRTLSLKTAYDTGKIVKVVVLHTIKGKNCMAQDAMSIPYLFALVDTKKPIEIVQKYVTKDCG